MTPIVFSPIALGALLLLVLGGAGAYAYSRYRARRVIPLPFNSATMIRPPTGRERPALAQVKRAVESKDVARPPSPAATQVHADPASDATVLHTGPGVGPALKKPRVQIKIVRTVDPSQVREQTIGLPCVIGRENAHVTITGDPKISRAHAEIKIEDGKFVITDRNSVNGTFVDDVRIARGMSTPLTGAATVRLGPNTMLEVVPKE